MPTPNKPIIDAEEVARERAKKRTMPSSKSTVYGKSTMPSTKGTAYGKKTMPMPKKTKPAPGSAENPILRQPPKPAPGSAENPILRQPPSDEAPFKRHGGGPGRVH